MTRCANKQVQGQISRIGKRRRSRDQQPKDSTLKIMLIDFGTCKIFLWLCLLCDVQYVQALLHLSPSTMHSPAN